MDQKSRLRLVLDVDYALNGVQIEHLKEHLDGAISRAIHDGALSGHTDAEVQTYSYSVNALPAANEEGGMHSALGRVIDMAKSHVEDIQSGLQDGIYDADDNQDFEEKAEAVNQVDGQQDRIMACLEACQGVSTDTLVQMGVGSMGRQRDHAHTDRMLYSEIRKMLIGLLSNIETEVNPMSVLVNDARKLIAASEPDDVGRPAGSLLRFVRQISGFQKWTEGKNEPSEGAWDSHACLMDMIDEARAILSPHKQ